MHRSWFFLWWQVARCKLHFRFRSWFRCRCPRIAAPPPPSTTHHRTSPPHFLDALTLPPAFSDDNYGNHNNLAAGAYLTQFVVQLLSCSVVQLVSAAFLYPASCYYCRPGKFAFNEKPKSAAAADARNLPALAVSQFQLLLPLKHKFPWINNRNSSSRQQFCSRFHFGSFIMPLSYSCES